MQSKKLPSSENYAEARTKEKVKRENKVAQQLCRAKTLGNGSKKGTSSCAKVYLPSDMEARDGSKLIMSGKFYCHWILLLWKVLCSRNLLQLFYVFFLIYFYDWIRWLSYRPKGQKRDKMKNGTIVYFDSWKWTPDFIAYFNYIRFVLA